MAKILSLNLSGIKLLLLCFKLASLFPELISFKFQGCHILLVSCDLSQEFSVGVFFIQEFFDKGLSIIDACGSFDVLECDLNGIELRHLSIHFIPQQPLNESSTEIDFIPILLFAVFVLKSVLGYLFHLQRPYLLAAKHILFLIKHGLNTVEVGVPLPFLIVDVID